MQIKYNFAQISNAASDIRSSASRIDGQLADLKDMIEPMTDSWEGEAAVSYRAHQAKWDQAAADLNRILNQISDTVEEGNNQMMAVNTAAANSWG